MAKGTGTYDDPIICDGIFSKTINGVKKFFKIKTGSSVDTSNFVKKSGDTLTGVEFTRNVDNSSLKFYGGTNWCHSASISLTGNKADNPCSVDLYCHNPTSEVINDFSCLHIQYKENPTWNSKPIEIVNSIGYNYIRYESGIQIEWDNYVASSKKENVNFPMPFKNPPIMSVTLNGNDNDNNAVNFISYAHPSTTNFVLFTNWEGAMVVMYIAIGKWK